MRRLTCSRLTALGAGLLLAGCVHKGGDCSAPADPGVPLATFPLAERGPLEPALFRLPTTAPVLPAQPLEYRKISARESQCLAVENSTTGNMLDDEREAIAKQAEQSRGLCAKKKQKTTDLQQAILCFSALEARNRDAGTALEYYYRLAEMEAKIDLVGPGLKRMLATVEKSQEMRKKGLRLPLDPDELVRKAIELRGQQVQLDQAIEQLNGELRNKLGLESCADNMHIWPGEDFAVTPEPIDMEAAVALGLQRRPELRLLRELIDKLDAQTLAAVRQATQSFNLLLGMAEKKPKSPALALILAALHCKSPNDDELEARRQQLQQQLAERERAVAQEVRLAVRNIYAEAELVVLARERVVSFQSKVQDLEDKGKQGLVSFIEITQAEMEHIRARGELVKEVMAWHFANAKLKQAQGILPEGCGYDCDGNGNSGKRAGHCQEDHSR